jgi:hypothetical protein
MSATPETPSENPTPSEPTARRPRDATPEAEAPLCPQCGYDLRGISSRRCPECGMAIDRTAHLHSRIPWTYRAAKGRVRTYVHTVLLMTAGTRRFRDEIARPVSYRDARRFWMVTGVLVALALAVLVLALAAFTDLDQILRDSDRLSTQLTPWQRAVVWDGFAPAIVGARFLPLMPLLTLAAVLSNLAILPMLLHGRSMSRTQRARAVAVAYYAGAPLVWWAILAPLTAIAVAVRWPLDNSKTSVEVFGLALWTAAVIYVPPIIAWVRSAYLFAGLSNGGLVAGIGGAIALLLLWALNTAFWLGVIPWLVGLLWMLGRSL